MVLDAFLLNTQHYKVHIKGKVKQSRERSTALSNTSVLLLLKREPSGRPQLWLPALLYLLLSVSIFLLLTYFIWVNLFLWQHLKISSLCLFDSCLVNLYLIMFIFFLQAKVTSTVEAFRSKFLNKSPLNL